MLNNRLSMWQLCKLIDENTLALAFSFAQPSTLNSQLASCSQSGGPEKVLHDLDTIFSGKTNLASVKLISLSLNSQSSAVSDAALRQPTSRELNARTSGGVIRRPGKSSERPRCNLYGKISATRSRSVRRLLVVSLNTQLSTFNFLLRCRS